MHSLLFVASSAIAHTCDGDINVMLRSPGGVGTDLIGMVGLLLSPDNFGSAGVNYTNMVIDDDAPSANDMFAAPDTSAPYTGSWVPIYNTPTMSAFGIGSPDPAGTLSRYDGTSTKGTWKVLAADHATPDRNSTAPSHSARRFSATDITSCRSS